MKTILLATQYFPYSKSSEVFLLNEIYSIPDGFKMIIVAQSATHSEIIDTSLFNLSNVEVLSPVIKGKIKVIQKIYNSICSFFSLLFWKEFFEIVKGRNFIFGRTKKMLYSLMISRIYYRGIIKYNKHIDIIYSYWLNYSILALIKLARKRKIKIVSRVHGHDLYDEVTSYKYHPFMRYILSSLDYCFPISVMGNKYLVDKYKSNYRVFHLGTKDYGISLGKKKNDFYHFVSCSSVIPIKRVDLIYKVLSSIYNRRIIWTHFGGGSDFKSLQSFVVDKPGNLEVKLMGHVDNQTLIEFYKKTYIDCFINLSTSEGIPVSIMEAESFGIPIIATNVGGVKEILFNEINGLLIDDIYSVENIISAISKFLSFNSHTINEMRKSSRFIWNENYNAEINYRNFYSFLDSII